MIISKLTKTVRNDNNIALCQNKKKFLISIKKYENYYFSNFCTENIVAILVA